MTTFAARNWYERDGVKVGMTNGRSGYAAALQTSPADETTETEVIHWIGTIYQLQVATGPNGGKHSFYRTKPLNVRMEGDGHDDDGSVLRSCEVGEEYANGTVDRSNPAVHKLLFTDCMVDVTQSQSPYPIVAQVNTALGTFGAERVNVLSSGVGHVVKTVFRGNASGRYVFEDISCPKGTKEYVIYLNSGAGKSTVKDIRARNCGRGAVQATLRTTENNFYSMEEDDGNALIVENIGAVDCGSEGGSAVSIAGWADHIEVRRLNVDSIYNTAGISLRFDKKQTLLDKPWDPKKANIIGKGKLLQSGHAHGTVILDLEESYIRTGRTTPGQASKSSRPAVIVDSCYDLWLISDESTEVIAGWDGHGPTNKSLHLEHQGNGDIRTVHGEKVGTRAVESFKTSGNFSSFGPMYRAGQPISADEYMSAR